MWEYIFQAVAISLLLYGCTSWTLMKPLEKKLDENYPRMLHMVLNKIWKQLLTKQYLYIHLHPISQTIQLRWAKHVGLFRRSKDKLKWHPPQDCANIGCHLEDLPTEMMARESQRNLCCWCTMMMRQVLSLFLRVVWFNKEL